MPEYKTVVINAQKIIIKTTLAVAYGFNREVANILRWND